jgi:acyl-CoA synthetase (AMP-forming)/AMP-acid ligase II
MTLSLQRVQRLLCSVADIMSNLWTTWMDTAVGHPSRLAVADADSGESVTCQELSGQADALASKWSNIRRGSRVAMCLPNGPVWLRTFLAIQRQGGVAIPLDPSLQGDSLGRMIRAIGADFLIDQGGCTQLVRKGSRIKSTGALPCCLKLTSGSSGDVKPVWCAARHLLADGEQVMATMGIRATDRNLAVVPLGHSYGLGNLVMPLLMRAVPVVCTSGLLPRHLLRVIADHRVTILPAVPAMLRALSRTNGVAVPPSLRLVISAGAPLAAEVAREFHQRFGLKIHNFYGSSETGGICYDRTGAASLSGRSVGKSMHGVVVHIRRDGRVEVKSPAVAMPRGRHVLPDVGEWTERGELRLLGRMDIVANIGGKKVSPLEIDRCLRHLTGVTDVWVTVISDNQHSDFLAAAVETSRSMADIERELAGHLPAWKLPRRYHMAPVLPRTDRGKLNTSLLRDMLGR